MKNINSIFMFIVFIVLFSCVEEDDSLLSIETTDNEIGGTIKSGEEKVIATGNYILKGGLIVEEGAVLIFDAGSEITANVNDGVDYLLVKQGGKLYINGTANAPVVFTEKSKEPGSWGGIIMYGRAPILTSGGNNSADSEDGLNLTYGGNQVDDSSGALTYVRVEYAGRKIGDGSSEMNGFSFYSLGTATVLQNLVSYKGADDGFEFYGGTVSAQNLISYGNTDDSFDWQDGWQGQDNTNWMAYQTGKGNYGMEIEASNNNNSFYPIIQNITLKREEGCEPETAGSTQFDAIQFKKQGNAYFTNVRIMGYVDPMATAVRIQDWDTENNQVRAGKIILKNIYIENQTLPYQSGSQDFEVDFPSENFNIVEEATGAYIEGGIWSTIDGNNLLNSL